MFVAGKKVRHGALTMLLVSSPAAVWACACGCGVFDVGTASMFPP